MVLFFGVVSTFLRRSLNVTICCVRNGSRNPARTVLKRSRYFCVVALQKKLFASCTEFYQKFHNTQNDRHFLLVSARCRVKTDDGPVLRTIDVPWVQLHPERGMRGLVFWGRQKCGITLKCPTKNRTVAKNAGQILTYRWFSCTQNAECEDWSCCVVLFGCVRVYPTCDGNLCTEFRLRFCPRTWKLGPHSPTKLFARAKPSRLNVYTVAECCWQHGAEY